MEWPGTLEEFWIIKDLPSIFSHNYQYQPCWNHLAHIFNCSKAFIWKMKEKYLKITTQRKVMVGQIKNTTRFLFLDRQAESAWKNQSSFPWVCCFQKACLDICFGADCWELSGPWQKGLQCQLQKTTETCATHTPPTYKLLAGRVMTDWYHFNARLWSQCTIVQAMNKYHCIVTDTVFH